MTSQRIQLKRSSVVGKRPDGSYLEPGELALNSNVTDPGLFFEANDGSVAKVGPTALGITPPYTEVGYGPGEAWYDTGNAVLNLWDETKQEWTAVLSPAFGGSVTTVYVGSTYPTATDDISNDGRARPFATLNRACIEVARRSILQKRSDEPYNDRFSIVLLPGTNIAHNENGMTLEEFSQEIDIFSIGTEVTPNILRSFNSPSGGVLLPRGTSIFGFDMRKTEIRPTSYPAWTREVYETEPTDLDPRSSIVKWTGNSYLSSLSFKDKRSEISVTAISGDANDVAILTSLKPHGFRALQTDKGQVVKADVVSLQYPSEVARSFIGEDTIAEGFYYVNPITPTTFFLRKLDSAAVLRKELPDAPGPGTVPTEFLNLIYKNTTHHRLSTVGFATEFELNTFYAKVQRAFGTLTFGGTVNDGKSVAGETDIVSPLPTVPVPAINSTENAEPFISQVSVRSDYGLCGIEVDGSKVGGFRSARAEQLHVTSLQNDPDVYEVFYDGSWLSLRGAYAKAYSEPITSVTDENALAFMVETVKLEDLRFYYRDAFDIEVSDDAQASSGLVDPVSDARHYAVKCLNNGSAAVLSSKVTGTAVGFWSQSGGSISSASSVSSYGTQALRAEGFSGIGTVSGSIAPNRGFTTQSIRRPLNVTLGQLKDPANHRFYRLNSNVASVSSTEIGLTSRLNETLLYPYTLKPGSVIYANSLDGSVTYQAVLADPALSEDRRTIYVEEAGNTFTAGSPQGMDLPYIRRFVDPRKPSDRLYSLLVANTSDTHRPPRAGSVLRFAEKPSPTSTSLLVPGKQLDPGQNGGWNHVFTVQKSVNFENGNDPNHRIQNFEPERGIGYYVSLSLSDATGPWVQNTTSDKYDSRYELGSFSTYGPRPFYAERDILNTGEGVLNPDQIKSGWLRSRDYEYCQPYNNAFLSEYKAGEDPKRSAYDKTTATYLRGGMVSDEGYEAPILIDADNGTDSLGLQGTGDYSVFGDPAIFDPEFSHSREAMARFLRLLGYKVADINTMLMPQVYSSRNLRVEDFPALEGDGYALSAGSWPVEFNAPSSVQAVDHTWEWSGYFNYAKGLPQYQSSTLTTHQRYDNYISESWGGQIVATGLTDARENVSTGLINTNGEGIPVG